MTLFSTNDGIEKHERHQLGQLAATSIAGNDITSSCLYVSGKKNLTLKTLIQLAIHFVFLFLGICAYYAGFWAPLALIIVSGLVLYLFRGVYAEVLHMYVYILYLYKFILYYALP